MHPEHAAAGLWCTPADLLHLAQAIQASLAGHAGTIRPARLAGQMITPQVGGWGLGLKISGDSHARNFSHGGENYGYECALIGTVHGHNVAAIMTISDQGMPVLEAMAAAITASTTWHLS